MNIRIGNTSPNIINRNTTPNIRSINTTPNIQAKSDVVHIMVKSGGSVGTSSSSGGGTTFGGKGYLIGMMALTYITTQTTGSTVTVTNVSDFKPNIRIRGD